MISSEFRWNFHWKRTFFLSFLFRLKISTVLKSLASSVVCDRSVNNLLTNLINSWTSWYSIDSWWKYLKTTNIFLLATKSSSSNEILSCCIDLCQNNERCQERLERFFTRNRFDSPKFVEENFVRLLPNLFKYLPSTYVLNDLFDSLAEILSETNPDAKTFCGQCGSIADEK